MAADNLEVGGPPPERNHVLKDLRGNEVHKYRASGKLNPAYTRLYNIHLRRAGKALQVESAWYQMSV